MVACVAGELCAAWIDGGELPNYAPMFSFERYKDDALLKKLAASNKGVLQGNDGNRWLLLSLYRHLRRGRQRDLAGFRGVTVTSPEHRP